MKARSVRILSTVRKAIVVILLFAAFLAGYMLKSSLQADHVHPAAADANKPAVPQKWYCSMHPQIIRDGPGKCPICGMALVPMSSDLAVGGAPRQLVLSEEAARLTDIATSPVERKFVTAEIRMVGKIDYDETRVKDITAWVPGRIDRLYVDFTGTRVNKGDHMVYLYSQQLLEDQQALLAAVEAERNVKPDSNSFLDKLKFANADAVRKRLQLRGLTDEQIADIEKAGKTVDHITIYAPMGGIVIDKHKTEGTWVDTGMPIFTIADLSQVWVKLDAYESDMTWLRYGQMVEFTTEAYPGEVFKERISFIDPTLNAMTRTVKLRLDVANSQGKLKPEMFVRATVRAQVARGGTVMDPEMAGKWICPMHPSIVKTQKDVCDICGMDLVTTESLGYVKVDAPKEAPLVIPASAALITGKRAVVYVKLPDSEKPTFEGREVVLGPRAGDYYIVTSGLTEGESVVTKGNFKIDSALQIQAKPSMLSASDDKTVMGRNPNEGVQKQEVMEAPNEFRQQLWNVTADYLTIQGALAGDNLSEASKSASQALKSLSTVDMSLLSGETHKIWMQNSDKIKASLQEVNKAQNIEQMRNSFKALSDGLILAVKQVGITGERSLYRFHCPMAFNNKGADWLQKDKDTRNPYFGASMLKCGEVTEVIGVNAK